MLLLFLSPNKLRMLILKIIKIIPVIFVLCVGHNSDNFLSHFRPILLCKSCPVFFHTSLPEANVLLEVILTATVLHLAKWGLTVIRGHPVIGRPARYRRPPCYRWPPCFQKPQRYRRPPCYRKPPCYPRPTCYERAVCLRQATLLSEFRGLPTNEGKPANGDHLVVRGLPAIGGYRIQVWAATWLYRRPPHFCEMLSSVFSEAPLPLFGTCCVLISLQYKP